MTQINNKIFYFFYHFAHTSVTLDKVIIFCAVYLPYCVVLAGILFLFFHPDVTAGGSVLKNFFHRVREFFRVGLTTFLAWLLSNAFKTLFHFPRPHVALHNLHPLFTEIGNAFPSGHATVFSALAVSIFFINKKVGYVFMACALVIGLARIAAGVHFPIDILGGFILGSLVAYFLRNV